jgi:hypothetical protein
MSKKNDNDSTVIDIQDMMLEQMKRLSASDVDLDKEIKRSQALSSAGSVIINAAKVRIDAAKFIHQTKLSVTPKTKQLGNGK